jgi:hypothetical protein
MCNESLNPHVMVMKPAKHWITVYLLPTDRHRADRSKRLDRHQCHHCEATWAENILQMHACESGNSTNPSPVFAKKLSSAVQRTRLHLFRRPDETLRHNS